MKKILLCFLLAGCAASPPVLHPVAVDMPVVAPCITPPLEKPDFALAHLAPDTDLAEQTRAALIELEQRQAYEAALEAQIQLCQ